MSLGDVLLIAITMGVAIYVAATWKRGEWPWKRAGRSLAERH
jgi:hypothetical protein